jgi:hypothetical protein
MCWTDSCVSSLKASALSFLPVQLGDWVNEQSTTAVVVSLASVLVVVLVYVFREQLLKLKFRVNAEVLEI